MIFFTQPFTAKKNHCFKQAGFTVIELIVTLSIVIFATGLVMIRYASFNSSVLLNSLAYQVAFDLRETQSLAISVRGTGGIDTFYEEYGMYFDLDTPNQYLLFQDTSTAVPTQYNSGEEIGEPIIIDPRFTIAKICVDPRVSSGLICSDESAGLQTVSIAFARPNFDAVMYSPDYGELDEMHIVLGTGDNSSGIERSVIVTRNGQITVK